MNVLTSFKVECIRWMSSSLLRWRAFVLSPFLQLAPWMSRKQPGCLACALPMWIIYSFLYTNQVKDLPDQGKNIDAVDELEIQYYEIQLELYDVKLEILKSEEMILVSRLDSVKRLIKGNIHVYVRMKCWVTCLRKYKLSISSYKMAYYIYWSYSVSLQNFCYSTIFLNKEALMPTM